MIRTFSLYSNESLDEDLPWNVIIAAIQFAMQAMVHTML